MIEAGGDGVRAVGRLPRGEDEVRLAQAHGNHPAVGAVARLAVVEAAVGGSTLQSPDLVQTEDIKIYNNCHYAHALLSRLFILQFRGFMPSNIFLQTQKTDTVMAEALLTMDVD